VGPAKEIGCLIDVSCDPNAVIDSSWDLVLCQTYGKNKKPPAEAEGFFLPFSVAGQL
jgi:hypothetical protein